LSTPVFILLSAIAVRTAIVFALLVLAIRFTGRRQFGEIDTKDIVVVLMISNAVQNSMTLGIGRLSGALVSAGTIFLMAWLFSALVARRPAWRKRSVGTPTVLVYNGRFVDGNMRREGVTCNELMGAARNMGLDDVNWIRLAVLEADGSISVIPKRRADGTA
jgi:uncharacterized membrane protein YcaP (DUF421 family)